MDDRKNLPDHEALSTPKNKHPKPNFEKLQKRSCFIDQVEDRVKGLELGADDYLVKPFAFSEFLARVRTLLRRGKSSLEPTVLQIADLELDLLRRRVQRGGRRIDLTAKEFALLELLLRRQGEVLPRSQCPQV